MVVHYIGNRVSFGTQPQSVFAADSHQPDYTGWAPDGDNIPAQPIDSRSKNVKQNMAVARIIN